MECNDSSSSLSSRQHSIRLRPPRVYALLPVPRQRVHVVSAVILHSLAAFCLNPHPFHSSPSPTRILLPFDPRASERVRERRRDGRERFVNARTVEAEGEQSRGGEEEERIPLSRTCSLHLIRRPKQHSPFSSPLFYARLSSLFSFPSSRETRKILLPTLTSRLLLEQQRSARDDGS